MHSNVSIYKYFSHVLKNVHKNISHHYTILNTICLVQGNHNRANINCQRGKVASINVICNGAME